MSGSQNCFYRISVRALILDSEKRFLLALEKNGLWELPDGGLDFGETPRECLARELKEETGLDVICVSDQPSYLLTALNDEIWKSNVLHKVRVKDLNFKSPDE